MYSPHVQALLGVAKCFAHVCHVSGVGAYTLSHVRYELCHAPSLAWQKPPKLVHWFINEVEDPGGIPGIVLLKERLSVCESCVEVVLLHPCRK